MLIFGTEILTCRRVKVRCIRNGIRNGDPLSATEIYQLN